MSLEFSDFVHFYEGSSLSDDEQREDFEVYACFMECLVRHVWRSDAPANGLGISVDSDTIALIGAVESDHPLQTTFNKAVHHDAAEATTP